MLCRMSPARSGCSSYRKASCTNGAPSGPRAPYLPQPPLRPRAGVGRLPSFDDVPGARTIDVAISPGATGPTFRRIAVLGNCRLATGGGVVVTSDAPEPSIRDMRAA
jgi:hypothetical protein